MSSASATTIRSSRTLGARVLDRWRRGDAALYAVVVLVTIALTVLALELWRADLTVPFSYSGDAVPVGAHFKTAIETGWYESNSLLGAPFGQVYHDFPTADNLNFLWATLIGLVIPDWAVAMNAYFLLGFPLAAASAVWLFRVAGLSRMATLALAPLFALAPYHFIRGEDHLFLASYYVVPLSLVLVIRVLRADPLWGWGAESGWRRWFGRGTSTAVIVALTATAQSYYAVFFLVLLAFAGVTALIRTRDWPRFWGAAIAGGLTVVGMLANMAPDLLYTWLSGPNPAGFQRGHAEAEIYALKLTQLLLPWSGHRIGPLRELRQLYDSTYPMASELPALGAAGAIGLIALFLFLAYRVTVRGRLRFESGWARERAGTFGLVASLVFVSFLFSTMGGLSTLISFVTTSLRGWNRMAIYISAVCLIATGILLDVLIRWIVRQGGFREAARMVAAAAIAIAVLGAGFIDQTPADVGDTYGATIARYRADQAWFDEVQTAAGAGSTILQLPYQAYPEEVGRTGQLNSQVLIPYLHTTDIAWTGGGIKGRPRADWPGMLERFEPAEIAELAAIAGMTGIHIDRAGLFSSQWRELEAGLRTTTGTAPLSSSDGRFSYFALDGVLDRLSAEVPAATLTSVREAVLNPVTLEERGEGFSRQYDEDGTTWSVATESETRLRLVNDNGEDITVTLSLTFRTEDTAVRKVTLQLPDGSAETLTFERGEASGAWRIDVPAGTSYVTVVVPGSEGEIPPIELRAWSLVADVVAQFLDR